MAAPIVYDRVKETSTTTGTGTLTLAGAVTGYRAFGSVFSASDRTYYAIENPTLGEWEVGLGTYSSNTLTRDVVYASSNGNSAVNFSSGTKYVWVDAAASPLQAAFLKPTKNLLINSNFLLFQRGAGSFADDTYGPDGWYVLTQSSNATVGQGTGSATPYSFTLTQPSVSVQRVGAAQIVEYVESYPMRNKTLRFQFRAKCSTAGTVLRYCIVEWTGTADSVTSDIVNSWTSTTYTAGNFFIASNVSPGTTATTSLTNSYQLCSCSKTISSSCNNLIVFFWTDSTVASSVAVDVCECLLVDATGTGGTLEVEYVPEPTAPGVLRCLRFARGLAGQGLGFAIGASNLYGNGSLLFCPAMRATPTLAAGASFGVNMGSAGTPVLLTAWEGGVGFGNASANWTTNAYVTVTGLLSAEL